MKISKVDWSFWFKISIGLSLLFGTLCFPMLLEGYQIKGETAISKVPFNQGIRTSSIRHKARRSSKAYINNTPYNIENIHIIPSYLVGDASVANTPAWNLRKGEFIQQEIIEVNCKYNINPIKKFP